MIPVYTWFMHWNTLSVPLAQVSKDGELPSRVLLFRWGINDTAKGPFLLDEEGAKSVLSYQDEHGADVMVDLEHLSLDTESMSFDPDARAWCRLETDDAGLWMTDARWTRDGEHRLRERTQRYVSPAFITDDEIEPPRITQIHNIALTAVPATHHASALMAAANRARNFSMTPEQMRKLLSLRSSGVADNEILKTLAIDIKSLQSVVKAMGGDPGGDLGSLMSTVAAYAKELADMAAGKESSESAPSAEPVAEAADMPTEEDKEAEAVSDRADNDELVRLRAQRDAAYAAQAKEIETLKAQVAEREAQDRVELTAELVRRNALTPAIAWADPNTRKVSEMVSKLSVDDLKGWVERSGGVSTLSVSPPTGGGIVAAKSGPDVSEYEIKRVRFLANRNRVDEDLAIERYCDQKQRQLNAAERIGGESVNRFGRRLTQDDVIASETGRIGPAEVQTLTNAVRPHEVFGTTAQRAIEEFRLDLMVNQATMPDDWTQKYGITIPGGTTKDTFPLDFSAVKYQERLGQNAAAETPQSRDIQLTKREFRVAKMGSLRRIQEGDFAYIRSWQQGSAQFARAKVALRAKLLKTALEAGTSTYWGYSADQPTGVEGVYYFATTHKVHPFNPKMTILSSGATTWSNYQASATPLGTANLFQELDSMLYVPHFDGELLGTEGDALLLPTSLVGVARRMFDQQAFRSDGETSSVQLSNEFYGRPMAREHASQLAGTDATADYYILSTGTIAQGFEPWVVAEDAADEILIWDESSDFYKDTHMIKVEEVTMLNVALAWPHGIHYVKGS